MPKDEFIGVRVSKEVKEKLRKEAKKEGMSISRYFESCIKGSFQEPVLIVESLIADAKEQDPGYWKEARKSPIVRQFEEFLPILISDFVSPEQKDPKHLPYHMNAITTTLQGAIINNIDSISKPFHIAACFRILETCRITAENLNKFKGSIPDDQELLVKEIRGIAEKFAYFLASSAFNKPAFEKVKKELDALEKELLAEIKKNERSNAK